MSYARPTAIVALVLAAAGLAGQAWAQATPSVEAAAPSADPPPPAEGGLADWLAHWADRVHAAQASQPHWITPLATVTPRLEQEFRFDTLGENLGNGGHLQNYDGGKGLELIPDETNEILINLPPYEVRSIKKPAEGFADWSFLTIKQRLLSANAQNGDYIVTAFFGVQAPTGIAAFTQNAWVLTPTLAAGKGWGPFDIQATIGFPEPLSNVHVVGHQITNNVTLQYHVLEYFWPEIEFNTTYWIDGQRGGKIQTFLTPGVVIGRIPLSQYYKLILGIGYQTALSPHLVKTPALTPTYDDAYLVTARVSF